MVFCRAWCGALYRAEWYFVEAGVVLCRAWCDTLNRAEWYFVESSVHLLAWRHTHRLSILVRVYAYLSVIVHL